jgi:predicted transcriptional regulator
MSEIESSSDVAALTVQLLSAYLANNTVVSTDLAELIRSTKAALTAEVAEAPAEVEATAFTPAVSVRKSLASPDHIVSLIDGKPYKVLKRHLAANGLTPDTYRERYGLPASYPMVAPTFAAHRRAIAEKIGLGTKRGPAPIAAVEPVAAKPKAAAKAKPKSVEAPVTAAVETPQPKAAPKPKPKKQPAKAPVAKAEAPAPAPVAEGPAPAAKPARAKRMARAPKKETPAA